MNCNSAPSSSTGLNHPQFGLPNSTIGVGGAGTITSTQRANRQMQFCVCALATDSEIAMNVRRQKIAGQIALQATAAAPKDSHQITELRAWPVREACIRSLIHRSAIARQVSGLMGRGETGRVNAADVDKARSALLGRSATAYAVTTTGTVLDPAINSAMRWT